MLIFFCVLLASVTPGLKVESDKISVNVTVESSVYTYVIKNYQDEPIEKVVIPHHSGHGFVVPSQWQYKDEAGYFIAWTDAKNAYITKNKTGVFAYKVGTRGAVLGKAKISAISESGNEYNVDGVWVSCHEPLGYVYLISITLAVIFLFHTIFIARRAKITNSETNF